jgi:hypothetical protein
MPKTYTPIATTTLNIDTASYTFSSIPSTYTDLILILAVSNTTTQTIYARYNSDTANNYSSTYIQGSGTAVNTARQSSTSLAGLGSYYVGMSSTNPTVVIFNLMNYSNTTTHKTGIARSSLSSAEVDATVNLWRNTSAINTIQVLNSGGLFKAGSTFTLYGIKAA